MWFRKVLFESSFFDGEIFKGRIGKDHVITKDTNKRVCLKQLKVG